VAAVRRKALSLFLTIVFLVTCVPSVLAFGGEIPPEAGECSSMIVGKNASATGEVLFGHNEDNGDNVMLQYRVPRMTYEPGEYVVFGDSPAQIPQVQQTWSYLWSETRASWKASFSDFFINEWGVAIASDSCSPSREDRPLSEITKDGGLGYGLRVLVAQRAKTAREGVEIAAALLTEYGYMASGRSYQIVDKDEGWVLQVVKGRHFVAKRVPDDEVFFIPNWYTIHRVDLNDTANYVASPDLITYAIERGWYTPAVPGDYSDFDFAEAYQRPTNQAGNIVRHVNALRLILGREPDDLRPFSVKPYKKLGVEDVKRVLRTHYEGTPDDLSNGYEINPHRTGKRTICTRTTMESIVVQFREQPQFTVIWRATLNPCTSPYVPWYLGIDRVPDGYGWLTPEEGMATHFNPDPSDLAHNPDRAWWTFQDVQNVADERYKEVIREIARRRDALEKQWAAAQRGIETAAYAQFEKDPLKAVEFLTEYTDKQAGQAWAAWRTLYEHLTR
jgi:dipeptidase